MWGKERDTSNCSKHLREAPLIASYKPVIMQLRKLFLSRSLSRPTEWASRTHNLAKIPASPTSSFAASSLLHLLQLLPLSRESAFLLFIIAEVRSGVNLMGGIGRQRESEVNIDVRVASGGGGGERNYFNRGHTTLLRGLIKGHRNVSRVSSSSSQRFASFSLGEIVASLTGPFFSHLRGRTWLVIKRY